MEQVAERALQVATQRDASYADVRTVRLDAPAAVEAVGRERRLIGGDGGTCLIPAVRIGDWDFTGATEH